MPASILSRARLYTFKPEVPKAEPQPENLLPFKRFETARHRSPAVILMSDTAVEVFAGNYHVSLPQWCLCSRHQLQQAWLVQWTKRDGITAKTQHYPSISDLTARHGASGAVEYSCVILGVGLAEIHVEDATASANQKWVSFTRAISHCQSWNQALDIKQLLYWTNQ